MAREDRAATLPGGEPEQDELGAALDALPPGRRGWARLAIRRPEEALALAREVTILRSVR